MALFQVSLILLLLLLIADVLAIRNADLSTTLQAHYNDGSEMNQQIIVEFIASEKCQQNCPTFTLAQLKRVFESFKSEWVEKMVNFIIAELGVDAESARQVRKNPAQYLVNYEIYKLLTFN